MASWILLLSWIIPMALATRPYAENFLLPLPIKNGSAEVYSTGFSNGIDSVQVPGPNYTSYEWWYFDAVSANSEAALVFQPDFNYSDANPLLLRLNFAFEDGTVNEYTLPGDKLFVSTIGSGSSGRANNGSYGWASTADMSEYTITMDLPEYNISGEVHYQSVAPAHGPCGSAGSGPLDITWELLWINPLPDAQVTANLMVNGSPLVFQGTGYHDKNWGPFNFASHMNQWYWGHGRAGDLSVVWFYHLNMANETSVSAYIAQKNTILHASCSGISVRPFGPGIGYPAPPPADATIDGYTISIDAGSLGNYSFTATSKKSLGEPYAYGRWIGTLEGGLIGGKNASGPALWEQMGPF